MGECHVVRLNGAKEDTKILSRGDGRRAGPHHGRLQLASSSSAAAAATRRPTVAPRAGGSLTVLEATGYSGDWPDGLDPATNIDGARRPDYVDAIFGQLFGPDPRAVIDVLATGYTVSSGGTMITINLRRA